MLDCFPIEILNLILNDVDQNSLVALSYTNTKFIPLTKAHLLKSIEVNSTNRLLSDNEGLGTQIRSIFNLKSFLKKLIENPQLCKPIQKLVFKKLPDLPEDFLINYFVKVFPHLTNLEVFKWYSDYNLDLNIVNLLPTVKLSKLNGNFKNFNYFNPDFSHLESLSLSGFKNFSNISINLSVFKNLKFLKISKKNLVLVEDHLNNLLVNKIPLSLSALNLENLFLTAEDIDLLVEKIDFSGLQTLKLLNCHELLNHQPALLSRVSATQLDLKYLEMDLVNNELNNVPIQNFIHTQSGLETLKVNLHVSGSLLKSLDQLVQHINANELVSLNIDFTIKSNNKMTCLQYSDQADLIKNLNKFTSLKYLKIPLFSQNLDNFGLTLSQLNTLHLTFLDFLKFKTSLIAIDTSILTANNFKRVVQTTQCPDLKHVIIKLFEYHIYDVKSKVVNSVPQLEN